MEIENESIGNINELTESPKKRSHNETEIENSVENENHNDEKIESSEQATPEVKRSRTENDNMNTDSDFEKDNDNSKNGNENENNSKEENNSEEEDIDETELEKDHHYCLNRLYLKRIIRENHASPIRQIVFNHQPLPGSEFDASNIVATVAKAGVMLKFRKFKIEL